MTTIRVKKDKRYSTIYNPPFENKALSWEARGLLAYLLTKPDDWTIMLGDLVKQGDAKLFKVRRMLKELDKVGHVKRTRINAGGGKFTWETTINERPTIYQSPIDGSSIVGSTIDGKPHDIIIPELPSTELPSTDRKESAPVGAPLTGTNGIVIFGEGQEYTETPAPLSPEQQMIAGFYSKPAMMNKWYEWEAYRVERKKKLTPTTRNKQIKFLLDQGEDAIAIMEQSMTAGWLGLFPLKQNGHAPKPAQPTQYTEEH